jgi:hypothetical protein
MIKYTHFNLYKKDRPNPFFGVEDWDDEADDFFGKLIMPTNLMALFSVRDERVFDKIASLGNTKKISKINVNGEFIGIIYDKSFTFEDPLIYTYDGCRNNISCFMLKKPKTCMIVLAHFYGISQENLCEIEKKIHKIFEEKYGKTLLSTTLD